MHLRYKKPVMSNRAKHHPVASASVSEVQGSKVNDPPSFYDPFYKQHQEKCLDSDFDNVIMEHFAFELCEIHIKIYNHRVFYRAVTIPVFVHNS